MPVCLQLPVQGCEVDWGKRARFFGDGLAKQQFF
jgi:hypothetical protein